MSDRIAAIMEEELAALTVRGDQLPPSQPAPETGDPPSTTAAARPSTSEIRDVLLIAASGPGAVVSKSMPTMSVDTVIASANGGVLIVGWVDDVADRLDVVRVTGHGWRVAYDGSGLARVRRSDVAEALKSGVNHAFGFWGFVYGKHPIVARGHCTVEIVLRDGSSAMVRLEIRTVEDHELREVALTYITNSDYLGAHVVEAIASLEAVIGTHILAINRAITRTIVTRPYVQRFKSGRGRPRGSIVVCLYGRLEFMFLQAAAFFDTAGMEDYEFVYVCNSPELAEQLIREARAAHLIYGIDQTVVLLTGNAGFGAANNVAVNSCNSDRIVIMNPDVFPAADAWAARHMDIVRDLPEAQTQLFGVPLFYDDGSLMHGGMYFDIDTGLSLAQTGVRRRNLLRVEHYGKGAPRTATQFMRSRPVPAVTGAFISAKRSWFERLGGFNESYVFGHYEDADLCLKSLREGVPSWLHDVQMWHLEGRGSIRLPVHEGGSLVNRWLFSTTWLDDVNDGIIGQKPAHPLLDGADGTGFTDGVGQVREENPSVETALPDHSAVQAPDVPPPNPVWKRGRRARVSPPGDVLP